MNVNDFMSAVWLLWNRWLDSTIRPVPGMQHIFMQVPDGYTGMPAPEPSRDAHLIFVLKIQAVVLTAQGRMKFKPVKDPETGDAYLAPDPSGIHVRNTAIFDTKEELRNFLQEVGESSAIIERVQKIPRFVFRSAYWPLIPRTYAALMQKQEEGREPSFEEIEGNDLGAAWDIFPELSAEDAEKAQRWIDIDADEVLSEISELGAGGDSEEPD